MIMRLFCYFLSPLHDHSAITSCYRFITSLYGPNNILIVILIVILIAIIIVIMRNEHENI
jgi:hypothetical protein